MELDIPACFERRSTVQNAKALDVHILRDRGALSAGSFDSVEVTWSCGDRPSGSVEFTVERCGGEPRVLAFAYTVKQSGAPSADYAYSVQIVTTPCHFGGIRFWFVCPKLSDGRGCGRRCRFLYLTDTDPHFRCRECQALTYESRQRHRETYWETFEKHYSFLKRQEAFKPPRGRRAKERRGRRLDASGEALGAWLQRNSAATLDAVVQRIYGSTKHD